MFSIALLNHKGGVGKSSIALNLAAFLSSSSSLLAIDLDPQANFSSTVSTPSNAAFDLLVKRSSISSSIYHCSKGFDIIAASSLLNAADELLPSDQSGVRRLRSALDEVRSSYDFVIIDTPPHLRSLALNALVAADSVIIPTLPDVFSSNGLVELAKAINLVKSSLNPSIKVDGIVLNRFKNTRLSHRMIDVFQEAAKILNTRLFNTKIRDSIKVSEANALQLSIFDYAPSSPVADDFLSLFKELFPDFQPVFSR